MSETYMETHIKIYNNSETDAFINVGPDLDGLDLVRITTSKSAAAVWGSCEMVLDKEAVKFLIKALEKSLEFAQ